MNQVIRYKQDLIRERDRKVEERDRQRLRDESRERSKRQPTSSKFRQKSRERIIDPRKSEVVSILSFISQILSNDKISKTKCRQGYMQKT